MAEFGRVRTLINWLNLFSLDADEQAEYDALYDIYDDYRIEDYDLVHSL